MSSTTRRIAWVLAGVAGVGVYVISTQGFPYHSANHDEAVYLQQAAMLLDGQLYLYPPVDGPFRPWFFVETGDRLYPKYSPVPAAMFAAGKLVGDYRLALGMIGSAIVGLTYGTVAEAFDRRTGLVAAAFVVASPLFLVDTAVFLPYAPTAVLSFLFAFAYLRAHRTGSRRLAAFAGIAIGVAFFARPYSAVLFAAPFVGHALVVVRGLDREPLERTALVGVFGMGGVLATLGYNAVVTGSPVLFPYEAFAPLDGLGFGRRELLGYAREYTPALALRANAEVVWLFFTEWFAAGWLGTLVAAVGLGACLTRSRGGIDAERAVLAGLFGSVVLGNVYFWGNLNILGELADPNDGFVRLLGPYYHYELLLPTAAFAAHGAIVLVDWWRSVVGTRASRYQAAIGSIAPTIGAIVLIGAAIVVAGAPIQANLAVSDQLGAAYEPFEERDLEGSLVFLPTPYGDWLNHPFQALRNEPGYDGPVVYALSAKQFELVDAFPDRSLYRYTYRGSWEPTIGPPVASRLQPVRHVAGERVDVHTTLGVPDGIEHGSIRLAANDGHAYFSVNETSSDLELDVRLEAGTVRLVGPITPHSDGHLSLAPRDRVLLQVYLEYGPGHGFTYRIELPVAQRGATVRALTPYVEACTVPRDCGGEAAYIPGTTREMVAIDVRMAAGRPRYP